MAFETQPGGQGAKGITVKRTTQMGGVLFGIGIYEIYRRIIILNFVDFIHNYCYN